MKYLYPAFGFVFIGLAAFKVGTTDQKITVFVIYALLAAAYLAAVLVDRARDKARTNKKND